MESPFKLAPIRPEVLAIETQQIMQVSTLAMEDPDVIAMWYGESDVTTPAFICDAASEALRRGQTFYTHKWGIPKLRETLATYTGGLYGVDIATDRVTVTSSGMTGIMMLMQALVGAGDNILFYSKAWQDIFQAKGLFRRGFELKVLGKVFVRMPESLEIKTAEL